MNRYRFSSRLLAGILIWFTCCPGQAAPRPNVILMMCDDLGFGDLRCFNPASPIPTPHIDAMASAGMMFQRFYAAAPVCSPTRGSCLTGRHPYRFGIYFANVGHLKTDEITLAELLRQRGYRTAFFGKWHLGTLSKSIRDSNRGGPRHAAHFAPPTMHGFDRYFATEAKVPTFDPMLKPPQASRVGWDALRDRSKAVSYGTRYWQTGGEVVRKGLSGDDSRIIMDRALQEIDSAVSQSQPFFTVIWFHAPHLPVVANQQERAAFKHKHLNVHHRNYFGCITALDRQVGRLRARLRQLEIHQNTMLWFCSDNGPEGSDDAPGSTGGLRGRKRSLYEGGIRVPGILQWPTRVAAGQQTEFAAVTSDYLPTVLAALGEQLPSDRPYDGVSLLPTIDGDASRRAQPIGFQSREQQALVGQRYKLIRINGHYELYDLQRDPGETNNIADQAPQRLATMKNKLVAWLEGCQQSDAGQDY